jgi:hypothetical protein
MSKDFFWRRSGYNRYNRNMFGFPSIVIKEVIFPKIAYQFPKGIFLNKKIFKLKLTCSKIYMT